MHTLSQSSMARNLKEAIAEVKALGGVPALKSGEWLLTLVGRSFKSYYQNANPEYFVRKYQTQDADFLIRKLTSVAARNAALLGVVVGGAVSTSEITALITGGAAGLGVPATLGIAGTSIAAEALLLVRIQLQLVAGIARILGVELDPDDPEDILVILAFAAGGSVVEAAGKVGAKIGGNISRNTVRKYVSKGVLKSLKHIGRKIGVKILQRTLLKYTVPVVSMGIGSGWNYLSTRAVSRTAVSHFTKRTEELGR